MKLVHKLLKSRFFYAIIKDKFLLLNLFIFLIFFSASFLSSWIAPQNPYDLSVIDLLDAELPPSWMEEGDERFFFGTDPQGRDLLSTILYGMRISIIISLFAVLMQFLIGVGLGVIAGYIGGKIDTLIMRIADIQLSLSTLMLAIIGLAIVKTLLGVAVYDKISVYMIIIVIGFSEWPQYARTVRASVMAEKKKEYVEAAHSVGFSNLTIMFRHIAPNAISPILVISTIQVANAIITEASLSFLGLGMPPTQPSLGALINSGFEYILSGSWWITTIPSLVLIVFILSINVIGDWLRDFLNPKLYKYN